MACSAGGLNLFRLIEGPAEFQGMVQHVHGTSRLVNSGLTPFSAA